MEKNTVMRKLLLRKFILGIIILIIHNSCAKESLKPELGVIVSADAMAVVLKGKATSKNSSISSVTIRWGDQTVDSVYNGIFSDFEIGHRYLEPGTYQITVKAIQVNGDSCVRIIPVNVNFKETSLVNIRQGLFKTSTNEFLVLTINLHTYQENFQNEKFNLITDLIGKMDIDFIAMQECAQHKNAPIVTGIIRNDNMAHIIASRLKKKYNLNYHFVWHWAHYGWDVWEEGVAVMSKHPILSSEDRFISSNTSSSSITSRKVMFAGCQAPQGRFNLFSAHTHWRVSEADEEQNNQINKIKLMVTEKESGISNVASVVCGDFNGNPTSEFPWSEGYNTMMRNNEYKDSFLEIYPDANNKPAQSKYNTVGGTFPGRIDYIFIKNNPKFRIVDSQIVFKADVVGEVSDHFGVLTKVLFVP